MMTDDAPRTIFDRNARRLHRDRALARFDAHDFLYRIAIEELGERFAMVTREFRSVLILGVPDDSLVAMLRAEGRRIVCADPSFALARAAGGVQCDEDLLPFADGSFDLVVAVGLFDTTNDLPGALALIHRVLRPDGLLLGVFAGAGALGALRSAMAAGDAEAPTPRIHPQVEVRAAGDLLTRAGFALPVADGETLSVSYRDLFGLIRDLRGMAATSLLTAGRAPLRREALARAAAAFAEQAAADGRTTEQFALVFLSGWKPDPSQPKPARRGSATASLSEALRKGGAGKIS